MSTKYQFATNIKCGGCIATVTPFLDNQKDILNWQVDLEDPERKLTVEAENISPEQVIEVLKEAGYTATLS